MLESDAIPPEMPLSEADGAVLVSEPLSSKPVGVSSSAEDRAKDVVEDDYETSFDIDPEEVRRCNEGFTRAEMRLEGSSHTIVIPMDRDLLVDTEDTVPSLGPLYSNTEGRTLATFDDVALSTGIAGLALRVSFSIFRVSMPCIFSSPPFSF